MTTLTVLGAGICGAIIGSFLNVLILRYRTGYSFAGRSSCLSCEHPLSWQDLIPVFSYIALRGRCRYCKSAIAWQYPLVEGMTAVLFALVASHALLVITPVAFFEALVLFFVMALLVFIGVYDIRHTVIPDVPVYLLTALSFAQLFYASGEWITPTYHDFLAGPLIAAPLAFLWLVSKGKWMGLGDAKLALALGWLLGLSGAIAMLVLSFWLGAIVGVALVLYTRVVHGTRLFGRSGRLTMKSEVAFGPFLIAAYLLVLFLEIDAMVLLA